MPRVYYDEEADYFRELEEERIELSGPTLEYYSLNRGTHVDPLYGEPTNDPLYGGEAPRGSDSKGEEAWNFYPNISEGEKRITFPFAIEYQEQDNKQPSVREEGLIFESDSILAFSRNAWECAIEGTTIEGRLPKAGDVIYAFENWWDIDKVGKGGNILDSPNFVGFRFELRKRSRYTPDRKVG